MIELAFIACLAGSPSTCKAQSLLYVDVPLMLCLMQGQAQLATWTEHNPGWHIEKWACRNPVSAEVDA
jgi:hypothetical protein